MASEEVPEDVQFINVEIFFNCFYQTIVETLVIFLIKLFVWHPNNSYFCCKFLPGFVVVVGSGIFPSV